MSATEPGEGRRARGSGRIGASRRAEKSSDAKLLDAWRTGDPVAGAALFERHFHVIRGFLGKRIDAEDAEDQHALMGVTATLADGQSLDLRIPAELGRRLCATFTTEEIHELVSCIAQGALDPVEGPLCCRKPLDNPFG